LLLPLVQGTDAWEFCKSRSLVNNGRGVWQALITQGDGDVTKAQRRWDARNILSHTVMEKGARGSIKAKFDLFKRVLQGAYNELEALGNSYSEDEKYQTLCERLHASCESYHYLRNHLMSNGTYKNDFTGACGFISSMIGHQTNNTTSTRNVSAVSTTTTTTQSDGRIAHEKWIKMSKEERKAHIAKMKAQGISTSANGNNNNGNNKRPAKSGPSRKDKRENKRLRTVESVTNQLLPLLTTVAAMGNAAPVPPPPTPPVNPAAQFGSQIQQLSALLNKGKKE
jgi:hypothetical protein